MIFNGREIQNYDIELNYNEINITSVEIDGCDVIDELFNDFDGIESEMVEKYKGSWGQFTGNQLIEIHSSLTECLKSEWDWEPEAEEKPEVKEGYKVGMVLRATESRPLCIPLENGALVQIVNIHSQDSIQLKILNGDSGITNDYWALPSFEEKEQYGLELVEDTVLNSIENASTQELLAELQKRLGVSE